MAICFARPSAITPAVIINTPPASERRRASFSARIRLTSTISVVSVIIGSPVLGAARTDLHPQAGVAGPCRAAWLGGAPGSGDQPRCSVVLASVDRQQGQFGPAAHEGPLARKIAPLQRELLAVD